MRRIYAFGLSLAALAGVGITHSVLATANSAAAVNAVSVNAVAATGLSNYTLNPASGSTVNEINEILISFPGYDLFEDWNFEEPKATFSNGEESYDAIFVPDFEGSSLGFFIYPGVMGNWHELEETTITTPGKWTLTITNGNYCEIAGQKIEEPIVAEYTIGAGEEPQPEVKTLEFSSTKPADGAVVKSLSNITVAFPDLYDGSQMDMNEEILPLVSVKSGDKEVAVINMDTLEGDVDMMTGDITISFDITEEITEPGTYTINFPEGCFVQKEYNWDEDAFLPVKDGFVSAASIITVEVSEDAPFGLTNYYFTPASGSQVDYLDYIMLNFPDLTIWDAYNPEMEEMEMITGTLSNGKQTYTAYIQLNMMGWGSQELKYMVVAGEYDAEEDYVEPIEIEAEGKWTLTIPAGSITLNDGSSNEKDITAVWYIGVEPSNYTLSPAAGETVSNLGSISITFDGAKEVEYNDEYVFLQGPDSYYASSREIHGSGNNWTITFRNPSAEGKYTLTIPEGTFTVDGEPNAEITADYNFVTGWTLTPAPGSTIETVEFTLAFPTAKNVEYVGSSYQFLVQAGAYNGLPGMDCTKVEDAPVPTFKLTAPEEAGKLPNGYITLSIEEGVFEIDGEESGEIVASYILAAPVSTDYIVSPESTIVLQDYGFDVAFIFDESARVSMPSKSDITVTLADEEIPAGSYEMMSEQNMLMFGFYDTSVLKAGSLKITIKEGAFTIGGLANPAIDQKWEVVAAKEFEYTVTPEGGVVDGNKTAGLEKITIEFPTATSAEVYNEFGVSLKNSNYTYYCSGIIEIVENETRAEGVKAIVTFEQPITEDGEYTFTMREGVLTLDGAFESPEIQEVFVYDSKLAGIESILGDENGKVTVVTLDGKVVLDNAAAAEIHNLKGLYIINGKKALLK